MLKNLVETKEGRRLVTMFFALVLIFTGVVWFYSSNPNTSKETDTVAQENKAKTENEKDIETKNATIYRGKWYSNRADNLIIELGADGTYTASSWITKGTYRLRDQTIIFEDQQQGIKTFNLQMRFGHTVMYLKEDEEEIMLFPNEEIKEKSLTQFAQEKSNIENLQNQKWLDILKNQEWLQSDTGLTYSMLFNDDTYEQLKKDTKTGEIETRVFEYRIIAQELEEKSCSFIIARNEQGSSAVQEIPFRVLENETNYELAASPGMFLWQYSYKKQLSNVELTQTGAQKKDAKTITETTIDEDGNRVIKRDE